MEIRLHPKRIFEIIDKIIPLFSHDFTHFNSPVVIFSLKIHHTLVYFESTELSSKKSIKICIKVCLLKVKSRTRKQSLKHLGISSVSF